MRLIRWAIGTASARSSGCSTPSFGSTVANRACLLEIEGLARQMVGEAGPRPSTASSNSTAASPAASVTETTAAYGCSSSATG